MGRISIATSHTLLTYYTILYYTILYYTILCWKVTLSNFIIQGLKTLQSTHMINQGGFFGSLVAGFAFISRDYYFGTPSDDCFFNVKKIFLITIMYMTSRDAFTAAKNLHIRGLKRYLMNRSSRVSLIFLFLFAKIALVREKIVVLLKKRAAGCFRNLYKKLLKVYQDECITYSLNIFVMDLISKL